MSTASQRRVERYDLAGRLDRFERTPSGGLRIPAYISRTGVQVYSDAEGNMIREFRPADQVLAEESWRSFEGAPVTSDHPPDLVTPETWGEVSIGYVRNVRPDGSRVAADLVIEDAEAIRAIEARELVETSAGYTATIAPEPGVVDGQPYDAMQLNIRGNHVALGPEGWGRAGPSVRLRIDAARQVIDDVRSGPPSVQRSDSMTTTTKRMVKIDGLDLEAGSDAHVQALELKISGLAKERDQAIERLTKERDEATKRADAAEGKLSVVEKEHGELKKKADRLESQEELDSRVARRLSLIDQARGLLGPKYKWAGKSDRQIMSDALKKAGHAVADDASADFVSGAFAHAVAGAARKAKTRDAAAEEPDGDESDDDEEQIDAAADDDESDDETMEDGGRRDGGGFRVRRVRRDRDDVPAYTPPPFNEAWRR